MININGLRQGRNLSESVLFWQRACPRCGGDIRMQHDYYGVELACLQCGHHLTRPEAEALLFGDGDRERRSA